MIQLYVVFHKNIFDECYENIPSDILEKYFTFIAVNEKIPKAYKPNKYKVINEWELPIYDKTFQERGYNENSAIYHVYANKLHKDYDYIGFFQYDMKFNDNIIDFLKKNMDDPSVYFTYRVHDFDFCTYNTWNEIYTADYIIKDYMEFFGTRFSIVEEFPLYNTYVITTKTYEKIMPWIVQLYDKLYPWAIKPPNATHFGHIAGIYERIMAYAISQEKLVAKGLNIEHDHDYKKISY